MTEFAVPRTIAVIEHVALFGAADRVPYPYAVFPCDIPAGARAIRVTLAYDHGAAASDDEKNLVDLGLLGPGPTEVGRAAFRGWSGSERSVIVVGEAEATPGYRTGPLPPGTWHILLGLYRIAHSGCPATIRAEVLDGTPQILQGARPAHEPARHSTTSGPGPMLPAGLRWVAVDLHAHTVHSDGLEDVVTLADRARAAGLEALFVTDHNTDAHLPDLVRVVHPALLPGEEVTTYRGHLNALGIAGWIEFRHVDAAGVALALDDIHAQGALASINHPVSPDIPWLHGTDLDVDCVEVWNGPWSNEDDDAIAWWDRIVAMGRDVVAVGGSDTHGPGAGEQPVGVPTTWVRTAGTDVASVLAAIAAGRVILTCDPRTPPPAFSAASGGVTWGVGEHPPVAGSRGDLVIRWACDAARGPGVDGRAVYVIADGKVRDVARGARSVEGCWHVPAGDRIGRVRLELRGPGGALIAFTNHIHLEEAAT